MGQKVNPINFRTGGIFNWKSLWFASKTDYAEKVLEDYKLREYLEKNLANAGLVEIEIRRSINKLLIVLSVARPGVVIGKGGTNLEKVKKGVERMTNVSKDKKDKARVELKVEEVKKPDLSAKLVLERIISQLLARYPHRRAVTQAMEKVMAAGAKGVKIQLSGRIAGAEIGRSEKYFQGSIPTQTLRANIDYAEAPAKTRSGYVGIKVWIYKGEVV
ncbi:MAG: 30S ribosomal protein S3 [Candidatus Pacebacteria bacterium GW2011_GWF2_38_9]|nr:MAG: ribosomal protein S3P [candidate division TM6 bacterium GW2011_GWF2_28_16]KKQ08245.1 MAG: 30S ribosomal protein S3 [Candidatus Pacebacteria bacterium GW2011_GWF1_36_5]KKQ88563.1 MAG: 30S ribosomal protein S3 [Candidatus Pacebacteria bacterium GW2011_GWF2_38_9]MBU1033536.1 30S ribosomal protein S3 [Patescibacteria group bacterium]HAZ73530.1 30S ribosomal protein S3 [Candidatus Paceibacterota bacterium]